MTSEQRKKELVEICHSIHSMRMVSGSGGNVSVRTENGIFITPSGVSLNSITEETVVFVDDKKQAHGKYRPSKETSMHLQCYFVRPDISAIVHVHSVYSVALACKKNASADCVVPVYTPGYGIRVGKLPVIPYYCPGTEELAVAVAKQIAHRDSVILQNHGLVTVGKSLEDALNLAEEIDENAKIHFILNDNGTQLTDAQIDELHARYR